MTRTRPGRRDEISDIALGAAKPILDVLETALDLAPVPGLGLIPKALSTIIDIVEAARANKESREAFIAKAKALGSAIKETLESANILIARYGGDEDKTMEAMDKIAYSEELTSGAQDLLRKLGDLVKAARKLKVDAGRVRGFLRGITDASRNKTALKRMENSLGIAVNEFHHKSQLAIDKGIQEIQHLLKEASEQRVIDSLVRADAGYHSVDERKSGFKEGTRKDLFDELDLWSTGRFPESSPKRFYFLAGSAGVGKTAIAHQLCKRLADFESSPPSVSLLGASFFFVRGDKNKGSARLLFPTLARQLASFQPSLRAHIVNASREYIKQGDRQQIEYAFNMLLYRPLVKASTSHQAPVFLVLDALDECIEEEELSTSLRLLVKLVHKVPWLYIFATSRPDVANIVHMRNLNDTLEDWEGDVERYLTDALLKMPLYEERVLSNSHSVADLVKRAGGLFIFARTALDTLERHPNQEEAFAAVLSPTESSPMDSMYLDILRSAYPPPYLQQFPRLHGCLLSLLAIIALQFTLLPPGAITLLGNDLFKKDVIQNRISENHALAGGIGLSKEDGDDILSRLSSVLFVTSSNGCVTPLHVTFGEFLLNSKRCDSLYHVDRGEGHAGLASACISAFSLKTAIDFLAACRDNEFTMKSYGFYLMRFSSLHLRNAAGNEELAKDLRTMSQGVQVPIMLRTTRFVPDSAVHDEDQSLWKDIKDFEERRGRHVRIDQSSRSSDESSSISSEYIKFAAYSKKYLDYILSYSASPVPQITQEDILRSIREDPALPGKSDFGQIDIERYRSVLEGLKRDIDDDARATDLWYDRSLPSKNVDEL
ncbi:uncharacterized protein PHACADRAFT_189303 [Phanerochaete carnosa HHB-10118-sp]|uniref:NACHT domain-containing protein n=1 Tax=Phanerochaete carnosa (strain HHB-10118-sp) TaxID=650164 RepID=K5WL70_PHACS|nr:uncharacterized protein PHACADRAFT_189303 [Phanerochaete carnosa HHB-10118-sp]EKM60175.1 hypothetical protein PHACADRAFT_189303 [Phanerochaete carnosa HHB-10118-sp]